MISGLIFDFSRVLLFPKDKRFTGLLNEQYKILKRQPNFHFFDHYVLNQELLGFIDGLKKQWKLSIFTSDVIQNDVEVREKIEPFFQKIFSAKEIGMRKTDPSAYIYIARKMGVKVDELLFIDDNLANTDAADEAGLNTIIYRSNSQIIGKLRKRLALPPA